MANTVTMDLQEYNELLLFKEMLKRDNEDLMTENLVLKEQLEECKVKNLCTPDGVPNAINGKLDALMTLDEYRTQVGTNSSKDFIVKIKCEVDTDMIRGLINEDTAKEQSLKF